MKRAIGAVSNSEVTQLSDEFKRVKATREAVLEEVSDTPGEEDPETVFLRPFLLAHKVLHSAAPELRLESREKESGVVLASGRVQEAGQASTVRHETIFGRLGERRAITEFLQTRIETHTGGSLYIAGR
jgi:hypothetical protein